MERISKFLLNSFLEVIAFILVIIGLIGLVLPMFPGIFFLGLAGVIGGGTFVIKLLKSTMKWK